MPRRIVPVVYCSASSQGFWPLADDQRPDALVPLLDGQSLFARSIMALDAADRFEPAIIVAPRQLLGTLASQLAPLRRPPSLVMALPGDRGSASAFALAALAALDRFEDPVLLLLPADRGMLAAGAPGATLDAACAVAEQGHAARFSDAPAAEQAGWPCLVRAETLLARLADRIPHLAQAVRKSLDAAGMREGMLLPEPTSLSQAPICDVEALWSGGRPHDAQWTAADIGWTRLDGWGALFRLPGMAAADTAGSAMVIARDCPGTLFRADGLRILAIGLEDMLVVGGSRGLMIAPKGRIDELRALFDRPRDPA